MTRITAPDGARFRCLRVTWHGDVCLATFEGSSLDENWIDEMGEELRQLVEREGCRKLVISFAELDCLYSVLLGKLMALRRLMLSYQGRLKLCEVPPLVREVFRVCRLEPYFQFVDTREEALENW
jgi:anti-sigma B factor antagonist